jgi:Uma2 family endonuclease
MKPSSTYQNTPMYFADAAAEYLEYIKKKHPEHFMESVAQATQRKITVAGLDLVAAERPDFYVYSELLIQWRDAKNKMRRVVPDNMVVVARRKPVVSTNFAIPIQPAKPFLVMEYVSKSNSRKDYQKSYDKYQNELKVPFYLLFYPEAQELSLFELNERTAEYASVVPGEDGYVAIPELDLTIRLLNGWVRFWWKGKLLPIPTEVQAELVRVEKENAGLRRENGDKTKILDDQARSITDKDRRIAELEAELERLRKSAG